MQTEPLPRNGVFILEAAVVDFTLTDASEFRQALCGIDGVEVFLFDPQPAMFAGAGRRKPELFLDIKISGAGAQCRSHRRRAPRARPIGQGHQVFSTARCSNTTACAASPSLRPT